MKVRSTLWAVMAAGSLLGCGEQPRYYRVAIDVSPLSNLPSTCYRSGTVPTDKTTNVVDVGQWVIWDGSDDRKYLQVGDIDYPLGDARVRITVGDAIVSTAGEKGKTTFATERTQADPTRSSKATYVFDKLGETVEGHLALSYSCSGSGCDPNCDASLHFEGRQLDVNPTLQVANTGQS